MAVTNYDEVTAGIRPEVPASDKDYVETKIEESEQTLETLLGDLQTWIDSASDVPVAPATDSDRTKRKNTLNTVVRRMVQRYLDNPKGLASETDGDYGYTRIGGRTAGGPGEVYATKADRRLLGIQSGMRAGTIRSTLTEESPMFPHKVRGRW